MAVEILGFTAGPDERTSGGVTTSDSLTLVAGLHNNGTEAVPLTLQFSLSDGTSSDVSIALEPGQEWHSWDAGPRPAGQFEGAVGVVAEIDGMSQVVGNEQIIFDVAGVENAGSGYGSAGGTGPYPEHNPSDYRFAMSSVRMTTTGGGVVHQEDEAFSTERVDYWVEVSNPTQQYLGPFTVHFLIDGYDIGWGGTSHPGLGPGESMWAQGATDPLDEGQRQLSVRIESGAPELFVGGEQSLTISVLRKLSDRHRNEAYESEREGWSRRMVYVNVRDYAGGGLSGEAYVEFSGPGGKWPERGTVDRGDLTLDNVLVPTTDGTLGITIASNGLTLTGSTTFDDDENGIVLAFTQAKRRIERTITDQDDFRLMLSERGQIGVDFKLFGLGAEGELEIASEQEWVESHSESTQFVLWVPGDILDDRAYDTTENR